MHIDIVNTNNEKVGALELRDEIFGGRVKSDLIWEAVVQQNASERRGTHATKNRALVSGSGKKPWRQKGTGRARVGEIRNPLWRKGGTVFGPQPRSGLRISPTRARPVPFCRHGFLPLPLTSARFFVACVPCRSAACARITEAWIRSTFTRPPNTSSRTSKVPIFSFWWLTTSSVIDVPAGPGPSAPTVPGPRARGSDACYFLPFLGFSCSCGCGSGLAATALRMRT